MGHISVSPLFQDFQFLAEIKQLYNPPTNKHVISLPLKRKVNHSQRFPEILNRPGSDSPTTDSSVSKILWIFFRTKRSPRNVSKKGFEKPKKNISPEKSQKHKKLRGKKFAPAIFVGRGWLFLGLLPPKKKTPKIWLEPKDQPWYLKVETNLGMFIPNWKA